MGAHLLGEVKAARIEHRLDALLKQGLLFGGAGGRQDPGSSAARHLQGGLAHPTGSRMDQHCFAWLEAGQAE